MRLRRSPSPAPVPAAGPGAPGTLLGHDQPAAFPDRPQGERDPQRPAGGSGNPAPGLLPDAGSLFQPPDSSFQPPSFEPPAPVVGPPQREYPRPGNAQQPQADQAQQQRQPWRPEPGPGQDPGQGPRQQAPSGQQPVHQQPAHQQPAHQQQHVPARQQHVPSAPPAPLSAQPSLVPGAPQQTLRRRPRGREQTREQTRERPTGQPRAHPVQESAPQPRTPVAADWGKDSPTPPAGLRTRPQFPGPQSPGPLRPGAIGQILVDRGALAPNQLAAALQQQQGTGKRIGTVLTELGIVTDRDVVAALAQQAGLPLADLRRRAPAPDAARLLPEAVARGLGAIPLSSQGGDVIEVAITDPAAQEELRRALGRPVRLVLATPAEVRRAIDNTYRALVDVDRQVAAFSATQETRPGPQRLETDNAEDDAPVVRIVNMMLTQALRDRASDIHIEPQDGRVRVRFRIDGALHDVLTLPADMSAALASRIKIMAGMNIVERRRPQDGQITSTIDDRAIDIRVATTGTIWGEKVVLRILDKSRPLYKLGDLGMPSRTHEAYSRMIRSPYGMVICAGPTGSGKTATLYASMTEVNGPERNITTIEDPVEYVFPSINQIQINETAGITFATGLRSILRQDPDMILVGEMRDVETARIAVQSALTGHFVLSSLHATDAVSALYRFLDMGIESFLVASSVIGVVGQRLVRRMCGYCRVPYRPSADEEAFFRDSGGSAKSEFWTGEGCNFCSGTGYSDRVGVYELLAVTEQMRELIVAPNPSHDDMRRLAVQQGMRPLRAEGVRMVEEDVTTIAEIVRSIYTL